MLPFRCSIVSWKHFYAAAPRSYHLPWSCRVSSSVFIVDRDNMEQSRVEKERCSKMLNYLERKKKNEMHVNLGTVRRATELLLQHDLLGEENAMLLISSCGKDMVWTKDRKTAQAQMIFDVVGKKSTALANELLKIFLENDMSFNFAQILKRFDQLNIVPDENTFARLISGSCLDGNVKLANQVLSLFHEYEIEIPVEVYGYFAYGLCENGSPAAAIKLMELLLKHEMKISWNVFSLFLLGLAKQKDTSLVDDVLKKFNSKLCNDLSTTYLLKIYREFWKRENKATTVDLFAYVPVRANHVQKAMNQTRRVPPHLAAPYMKQLLSHFTGYLNLAILPAPLRLILLHSLEQGKSFEDFWDATLFLKKFDRTSEYVEFLAFSLLVDEDSQYCKLFLDRLSEHGIRFESPIPLHLSQGLEELNVAVEKVEAFLEAGERDDVDVVDDFQAHIAGS